MSADLERVIVSAYQQSWTTLRCIDEGPFEFQGLSADLAHLSETLQLLSDEVKPPTSVFEMATKRQTSELRSALDTCELNLSNLQTICNSFAGLEPNEQLRFLRETNFTQGASQYLRAKIINFSTALKELLVTVKISSTTLNWPPSMGVLERIQSELFSEGVPVENLEGHYAEIKGYLRHLAMGHRASSYDPVEVKTKTCKPSMTAISEGPPTGYHELASGKVTDLANQFSSLFEPHSLRFPISATTKEEAPHPKALVGKSEASEVEPPASIQLRRKDSMNPITALIASHFSAAMSNVSLSVNLHSKPHGIRPPPRRTSSAVFRGLADEERVTGE